VRDLVVELEGFMEKFKKVKPWVIRAKEEAGQGPPKSSKGTFEQSPAELAEFKHFSMCINCLLCYSACPVVANEAEFLGPAAIALGHRYNLDSRDHGEDERNEVFRGEGTVFACSFANECSEVCPKNVDPAAAVNQAKFGAVIDWAKNLVLPRGATSSSSSNGDQ
jgi:fumarate reductase iron-sulfur subunit